MWPSPFHVDVINLWSLTCLLCMNFLFQKKLPSCCLNKANHQSILLKDISNPYKYGSSVKVNGISDGILRNFM